MCGFIDISGRILIDRRWRSADQAWLDVCKSPDMIAEARAHGCRVVEVKLQVIGPTTEPGEGDD
jgi:hypothetical protein